ncbi:MAG: membrane protein insertion efficiency factor YidD [Gammaproteobacteria bacterium]|jgi:putative membrane protein insertion efficiency factor|nr:membrane protein insertion efficiency factor YidD [Gammaproteobacteria bacterium]
MRWLVIQLIKAYRLLLSPWVGGHCRFHPTCSCYAITAIERFGVLRGSALSVRRLSRCHPWHEGGIDPVPDKDVSHSHG